MAKTTWERLRDSYQREDFRNYGLCDLQRIYVAIQNSAYCPQEIKNEIIQILDNEMRDRLNS